MSEAPQGTASESDLAVAIIGMAGRFPGAADVEAFWRNLRAGVESITFFSDDELAARGVDRASMKQPGFVKASPVLDRIARFDAALFGYAPREAELMDPQHRIFLECAWTALEHAGYDSTRYPGSIGVVAGTSISSYLLFNLLTRADIASAHDTFPFMVGNDKDFIATRAAYQLDLRGPSIDVQTGCSTSLVAVHLACQMLQSFQCDMALAGGVSVHVPQRAGYHHEAGGITSPDGHCRAFDAKAGGTLFGSGAGLVVLKRLEDALADGDTIYAVVKGSAINNDGASKVGFTAPGVEGQAEAIARAQAMAAVSADTIGYVETHGTATELGDPVEVLALTQAFRAGTRRRQFCALGSVKTNIGHLDAAAGIAGLIKTVQSLRYRELPASLHFEAPNPQIDFASSPFYVNAALAPWPDGPTPRRAGVSSFGIGGTNAHVVLEEAPRFEPPSPRATSRPWQVLPLSAKTRSALEAQSTALAAHLGDHPELPLHDVAFTLQMGRRSLEHRRVFVVKNRDDAALSTDPGHPGGASRTFSVQRDGTSPSIAFLFAGGGAQHMGMGRGLYDGEPVFREQIDLCCAIVRRISGVDLRAAMLFDPARAPDEQAAARQMKRTSIGLPALFAVQSAMARLFADRGIRPDAMIGHSLGEYAAAWVAGVLSLDDAVALVVRRGELFERLPAGRMLGVPLSEGDVRAILGSDAKLDVAAINGPASCVLAGAQSDIDAFAAELARREIEFRHIPIDVAAHSRMVEPILRSFRDFVASLRLSLPRVPFVSNVTGTWITDAEAVDPDYWTRHLRSTVRFGDGVGRLLEDPRRILVEIGPGRTLSTLAKLSAPGSPRTVLASMRHPHDVMEDGEQLAQTTGRLWLAGASIDWPKVHGGEPRRRVALPTYPFEGKDYWIAPEPRSNGHRARGGSDKNPDIGEWFYQPSWERRALATDTESRNAEKPARRWLVVDDRSGLSELVAQKLAAAGERVERTALRAMTDRLGRGVGGAGDTPFDAIVHLGGVAPIADRDFDAAQVRGCQSLLSLSAALGDEREGALEVVAVGAGAVDAESADHVAPERATVLAACKVLPQEDERIRCRYVDIEPPADMQVSGDSSDAHRRVEASGDDACARRRLDRVAEGIVREALVGAEPVVALRGPHRWIQTYVPLPLAGGAVRAYRRRHGGVYLITGGLGRVGLRIAEHLARAHAAKLVLVSRTGARRSAKDGAAAGDAARAIEARLTALGADVMIARADVADEAAMRHVVDDAIARFGAIHGVIHAAGLAGEDAVQLASALDPTAFEAHFRAKARGTEVLERVLADHAIDFCVLVSSIAGVLGGIGLAAYTAANVYLDAFAAARSREPGPRWISVGWDHWPEDDGKATKLQTSVDRYRMTAAESVDALDRILMSAPAGHVVVSTGDLDARWAAWVRRDPRDEPAFAGEAHARPDLGTEYVAPASDLEKSVVAAWETVLGVDRIGAHDNFFDLGGNSLLWLKIAARLKKELGRDVPLTAVFEAPSAVALAALLGQAAPVATYEESQARGAARRARRNRMT